MKISIVTSLFQSSQFIKRFYDEYIVEIKKIGLDYEFIFVDDGSSDNSILKVLELKEFDKNITLINLTRNFGQYPAIFAGLNYATGDYVYVCDVDMEDPVSVFEKMYVKLNLNSDCDLIYSFFEERNGGFVRGFLGNVFYKLFNSLSEVKITKNQSWQRMMTKRFVKSLLLFKENETIPSGLFTLSGYNSECIKIERIYKGFTSYTLSKRLRQAFNGLISFSSKPLIMISKLGFLITLFSFIFMIYILYEKIFVSDFQAGWLSLIISIWLVGGIIIFSVGILGLYISKIFNQVKSRPLFLIKEIL